MYLILAICGLLAMVWVGVFFRHAGLLAACLMTLLMGICLGSEFFHVSILTLDRVWWGVTCGAFWLYRRAGGTQNTPWRRDDTIAFAFLATLAISTFSHDWRWHERLPFTRWLFYYFLPFTMYFVARELRVSEQALRRAYIALACFGVYLGLTALAEVTEHYSLVFPRYIASPQHAEFLGRGRGPLLNPSGNGILLSATLFALWLLWPHSGPPGRLTVLAGTAIIGAGILATLTRCVWMGAALGGLILVLCGLPTKYRLPLVLSLVTVSGLTILASWQNLTAFKRDKNVSVADMKKSASLRPILAYVAWQVFQDHPVFGVGFGQYKRFDKYYLGDRSTSLILEEVRPYHQHNVFLSLLTETGLLGMSLYASMLITWSCSAWRLWSRPVGGLARRQLGLLYLGTLAAYLVNGMFQDVTIVPMIHSVLFFLAGLTVGGVHAARGPAALEPLVTETNPLARLNPLAASRQPAIPCDGRA